VNAAVPREMKEVVWYEITSGREGKNDNPDRMDVYNRRPERAKSERKKKLQIRKKKGKGKKKNQNKRKVEDKPIPPEKTARGGKNKKGNLSNTVVRKNGRFQKAYYEITRDCDYHAQMGGGQKGESGAGTGLRGNLKMPAGN